MEQLDLMNFEEEAEISETGELILKPLQKLALEDIRIAFTKSKKIIFQAATAMGKTIVATEIIKNALEKGNRVAFICDRIVLVQQTSDVFKKYGIPHGVIQAQNERFDLQQKVQVCSVATIKHRGCPESDLYIIDEAHVLTKCHKQLIADNPDKFFLGMTATPYAKGLGKYFDFHIEPVTMKQLINNKYLVPYDIYGPSVADLSKLKIRAGEFTEESVSEVFDKADIVGDVVSTWQKITPNKKTIVFGANIAHIKHLSNEFEKIGVKSCQINAYQSDKEREEALNDFLHGKTQVLCSVEVATKGFDCPSVEVAIMAVATRSMIKWQQCIGRALRTFEGKEKAIILDFGGNAERLGFPDDYEFLGLDDGKRREHKKQTPKERLPKVCPSCDFIKPVGMHECPACGFKPERIKDIEAAEGELEKIQRKNKKDYTIEEKQRFIAQLNYYAAEHKMKRHMKGFFGWAIYAYADKFGCRPSGKIDWSAMEPTGDEVRRFITYRNIKYAKRTVTA